MSEPTADASIPKELGQQAEDIKDAHLEPNKEENDDSGSEEENEDSTAVNGAGKLRPVGTWHEIS